MDKNETKQVSNEAAEQAIRDYVAEQSKENLSNVLNLLRPAMVFVPVEVNEEKKAAPLFIKNREGKAYLPIFTGKGQIPEHLQKQTVMIMQFPMCNGIVANEGYELQGMAVNPYTDNLLLSVDLIKRLYEADKELAKQMRQQKQQPQQKAPLTIGDMRRRVEYVILPKRLYTEGEEFVQKLCSEKEALVADIFEKAIGAKNPYKASELAVMALDISSDLTLVRIDMPGKSNAKPFCYRVYITLQPQTKKVGYYTIEEVPDQEGRRIGMIQTDGSHRDMGEAPVEGVELQEIIELAQKSGN